jgi:hypothetical protein
MASHCTEMEEAFGTVVIVVAVLAAIAAVATSIRSGGLYQRIGRGAFSMDTPERPSGPAPGSAAARAESEEELRQLLEAKSYRRERRGEAPLDVEAELAALRSPGPGAHDPALIDEVRQLVLAANERRARRGEPPLDVDAEVARQLRDLGA